MHSWISTQRKERHLSSRDIKAGPSDVTCRYNEADAERDELWLASWTLYTQNVFLLLDASSQRLKQGLKAASFSNVVQCTKRGKWKNPWNWKINLIPQMVAVTDQKKTTLWCRRPDCCLQKPGSGTYNSTSNTTVPLPPLIHHSPLTFLLPPFLHRSCA